MASGDDETAVYEVLLKIGAAFRGLDATGVEGLYVEDADWTNAFGTTLKGNREIAEYLRALFADAHFAWALTVKPPEASVRFLGDDVAVAKTYLERAGRDVDGRDAAGPPQPLAQGAAERGGDVAHHVGPLHGRPGRLHALRPGAEVRARRLG